jgi:hypothetical protein
MSTQKPQPKGKAQSPEQRDDLDLDAETIRDLEPGARPAGQVRGGVPGGGQTARPCTNQGSGCATGLGL